jgi:hypothetical protein
MKTDSLKWINDTIRDPEDGKPFILYPAETRLFVPRAGPRPSEQNCAGHSTAYRLKQQ